MCFVKCIFVFLVYPRRTPSLAIVLIYILSALILTVTPATPVVMWILQIETMLSLVMQ